jgi:hypothetical protein
MDLAVLENGVNLIDTAESYPIPSDRQRPEGVTEGIIGRWMAKVRNRRTLKHTLNNNTCAAALVRLADFLSAARVKRGPNIPVNFSKIPFPASNSVFFPTMTLNPKTCDLKTTGDRVFSES